jgi:hypothetical protein
MSKIRFAQVLDDGTFGQMRFPKEKRERIDAITAQMGKPRLRWVAMEVTSDGSKDICTLCGTEFIATTSRFCANCANDDA